MSHNPPPSYDRLFAQYEPVDSTVETLPTGQVLRHVCPNNIACEDNECRFNHTNRTTCRSQDFCATLTCPYNHPNGPLCSIFPSICPDARCSHRHPKPARTCKLSSYRLQCPYRERCGFRHRDDTPDTMIALKEVVPRPSRASRFCESPLRSTCRYGLKCHFRHAAEPAENDRAAFGPSMGGGDRLPPSGSRNGPGGRSGPNNGRGMPNPRPPHDPSQVRYVQAPPPGAQGMDPNAAAAAAMLAAAGSVPGGVPGSSPAATAALYAHLATLLASNPAAAQQLLSVQNGGQGAAAAMLAQQQMQIQQAQQQVQQQQAQQQQQQAQQQQQQLVDKFRSMLTLQPSQQQQQSGQGQGQGQGQLTSSPAATPGFTPYPSALASGNIPAMSGTATAPASGAPSRAGGNGGDSETTSQASYAQQQQVQQQQQYDALVRSYQQQQQQYQQTSQQSSSQTASPRAQDDRYRNLYAHAHAFMMQHQLQSPSSGAQAQAQQGSSPPAYYAMNQVPPAPVSATAAPSPTGTPMPMNYDNALAWGSQQPSSGGLQRTNTYAQGRPPLSATAAATSTNAGMSSVGLAHTQSYSLAQNRNGVVSTDANAAAASRFAQDQQGCDDTSAGGDGMSTASRRRRRRRRGPSLDSAIGTGSNLALRAGMHPDSSDLAAAAAVAAAQDYSQQQHMQMQQMMNGMGLSMAQQQQYLQQQHAQQLQQSAHMQFMQQQNVQSQQQQHQQFYQQQNQNQNHYQQFHMQNQSSLASGSPSGYSSSLAGANDYARIDVSQGLEFPTSAMSPTALSIGGASAMAAASSSATANAGGAPYSSTAASSSAAAASRGGECVSTDFGAGGALNIGSGINAPHGGFAFGEDIGFLGAPSAAPSSRGGASGVGTGTGLAKIDWDDAFGTSSHFSGATGGASALGFGHGQASHGLVGNGGALSHHMQNQQQQQLHQSSFDSIPSGPAPYTTTSTRPATAGFSTLYSGAPGSSSNPAYGTGAASSSNNASSRFPASSNDSTVAYVQSFVLSADAARTHAATAAGAGAKNSAHTLLSTLSITPRNASVTPPVASPSLLSTTAPSPIGALAVGESTAEVEGRARDDIDDDGRVASARASAAVGENGSDNGNDSPRSQASLAHQAMIESLSLAMEPGYALPNPTAVGAGVSTGANAGSNVPSRRQHRSSVMSQGAL